MIRLQSISFIILLFIITTMGTVFVAFQTNEKNINGVEIVVQQGDTLWNLSQQFRGNNSNEAWIATVMELNQLKTQRIIAGNTIIIPENSVPYVNDKTQNFASN